MVSDRRLVMCPSCVRIHPVCCAVCMQVAHRRVGNVAWKPRSAGLFGRGQSLAVEATRPIRKGEQLAMDYAAGKPDGGVLLDYGVLDPVVPQVHAWMIIPLEYVHLGVHPCVLVSDTPLHHCLTLNSFPTARTHTQPGYSLPLALDMAERFVEDKVDILEGAGLQTSMTFTLSPSSDPSMEMMAFLRVMTLKGGRD